jgi:predicted RNase H-like nuclease (RuvC/YqgF family)
VDGDIDDIFNGPRRPQTAIRRPAVDHRPILPRRQTNAEYLTSAQRRARGNLLLARPERHPSRDQPVTDLTNPHPEYTALEDSRRELRAFRTQNQALRNEVAELTRNLVTREQEWREEQNRLIARLNTRQNELDSAARQIDTLRATIGNHRTASAADRSHLRAHQNIARYGTHTHPINPEILESESEDDTPPRSRPRHHH